MSSGWYEVDDDSGPTPVGKGLLMAGAAAFVWGAGCVALVVAAADCLWRRGRR